MKRFLAFLLTLCLMATLVPFTASAANITATMSSATANRGDKVTLTVTLAGAPRTTLMAFALVDLPQGITFVKNGSAWELEESDIANFNVANGLGAWAYGDGLDPNGLVLTLAFEIGETVSCGEHIINFEFYPSGSLNTPEAVTEIAGVIAVHSLSGERLFDESKHWQKCSQCDENVNASDHIYDNACDTTCNECGDEREREHDYNDDWECTVCGNPAFTYNVDHGEAWITEVDELISGDVIIPATLGGYPVTFIFDFAFVDCTNITSVTIPNSVTVIGWSAFYGCTSLESITIPDSVVSIRDDAFLDTAYYNNEENWEDGVLYIGNYLIEAKSTLSGEYEIKEGTKIIADRAFAWLPELTSIIIPNSVINIGHEVFWSCEELESVTIGNGVTVIGYNTFCGCTSLESITIPSSVTYIDYGAFIDCENLESITIPNSVKYVESNAFANTAYYNNEANWENGVLYIGNHLIGVNREILSGDYEIKAGTKSIPMDAFTDCENLTSITIPESVRVIGTFAFEGCDNLENVYFENTKGWIGENVLISYGEIDEIFQSDLSNPQTAAQRLRYTYCGFEWSCGIPGDIDGDESITANDAIYLLYNIFFGEEEYPVYQPCDFDGDSSVTANDAIYLLYHVFFGDEMYPLA